MSVSTIRPLIKTSMEAVAGIGKVLDYVVWTDDWQFIYDKFSDGERVHVWFIGLGNSPAPRMENGIRERTYVFNLVGFYSLKTESKSSQGFESVVDAILAKFDTTSSLGAGLSHTPPSLVAVTNQIFSQHPVHNAQIQLSILERTAVSDLCQ